MDAVELVWAFMARAGHLSRHVGTSMSDQTGGDDLLALHRAVIQGRAPRVWQLPSGVHYRVHGIGCCITTAFPERAVVDVDLSPRLGVLIFDAWRVEVFAKSVRHGRLSREAFVSALRDLTHEGSITPIDQQQNWYAVE
ncbi:DUF6896 domain-containing protein [Streptosporangium carneum]|uniref:DUF6896 domain-containing protein n=1 Tax=Streptosporangium carneum TaxID=47481 RepID=A0A9W6I6C4_9ACTN|nr:hypothetical protein [Streptosporangium carneum]GLK11993.1 hypothetical protein GCM10017600_54010 [Streptosporangium carneum]